MSSKVPKRFRNTGHKPKNYSDVAWDIRFVCSIVKVAIGPCRLVGSYANGIPFKDSDIDIAVEKVTPEIRNKVHSLSTILGVKIDISTAVGGFEIE